MRTPVRACAAMHLLREARAHWADPFHRNAWLLTANSAAGAVFGFLFWLVVARVATPAAVGAGAALVSAATLAALLGKFGLDAALVRYAPALPRAARARLLLAAVAASAALASLVAAGILAAHVGLAVGATLTLFETAAFVVFAASLASAWVLDSYFIAERRAGRSLARNLVHHALRVALPLLAAGLATPFGILAAWGVGTLVSLALAVALALPLLAHARASGETPPSRAVLARYAGVNYAVNVSEWLPTLALPLVVFATLGAEANARFYVAWTLASVGFFASKAIGQSAFAELSSARAAADVARRARAHSIGVLLPFALALVLLGPFVLALFGPAYASAWPLLAILAVSAAPVAVMNLRLARLRHLAGDDLRPSRVLELALLPLAPLVGVLAAVPITLARTGVEGVALAWLAANTAAAVWCLAAGRRTTRGLARPQTAEAAP